MDGVVIHYRSRLHKISWTVTFTLGEEKSSEHIDKHYSTMTRPGLERELLDQKASLLYKEAEYDYDKVDVKGEVSHYIRQRGYTVLILMGT